MKENNYPDKDSGQDNTFCPARGRAQKLGDTGENEGGKEGGEEGRKEGGRGGLKEGNEEG